MESSEPTSIVPASDRSLLVTLGEQPRVLSLLAALDSTAPRGLVDASPALGSILLRFEPLVTDHQALATEVRRHLALIDSAQRPAARLVEIPVCYGGELGPDLADVARFASITEAEAIALHCGQTYDVLFLGFSPGFAYLGSVPEVIACPRLERPRAQVPAGSVAIAGTQSGVYPSATPGGWRIIGRTPLTMFDVSRAPMSRLEIGDRVRFTPIDAARFRELQP